jgi:hypothetical protein
MAIHDLPKKWRERANGDAGMLTCADELEAHIKNAALLTRSVLRLPHARGASARLSVMAKKTRKAAWAARISADEKWRCVQACVPASFQWTGKNNSARDGANGNCRRRQRRR